MAAPSLPAGVQRTGTKLDEILAVKQREIADLRSRRSLASLRADAEQSPYEPVDFAAALRRRPNDHPPRLAVIAEVKRASPSAGTIAADIDSVAVARAYVDAGANALSVLTDRDFFRGSNETLQSIRDHLTTACSLPAGRSRPPVLRKDFLIDEAQIYEARAIGADAVLLIAECLEASRLRDLHQLARSLGMQTLIELYEAANLPAVLAAEPSVVGVNNRDLRTFTVDIEHSRRLRAEVPPEIVFVSESGLATGEQTAPLIAAGVDAILVGETLMKSDDVASTLADLATGGKPPESDAAAPV